LGHPAGTNGVVQMTLTMTRPTKHPKTGIYQFRRAIPDDLQSIIGKREEKRSLGTKDPEEAKRRFATVLAEIESKWANLRLGPRSLSEREAHELAMPLYENWLKLHRDNPSEQFIWFTELYQNMWTATLSFDSRETEPEFRSTRDYIIRGMRIFCFRQADYGLEHYGMRVDATGRARLAKAIGAAFQRASLVLECETQGIYSEPSVVQTEAPLRDRAVNSCLPKSASASSILQLLEGWWIEARATGRKPSTYENYKNSIRI